jgi:hypothetical protein
LTPAGESKGRGQADKPAHRAYRGAVRGFSTAFVAIGLLVLVVTLAHGGGPASVGVLMGIAFVAVGVGRLWVSSKVSR